MNTTNQATWSGLFAGFLLALCLTATGCGNLMKKINQSSFVKQVEAAPAGEGLQLVPGLVKLVRSYKASPEEVKQATAAFNAQTLTPRETSFISAIASSSTTSSGNIVAIPISQDRKSGVSRLMLFDVSLGTLASESVYEVAVDQKTLRKAAASKPIKYARLDGFDVGFPISTFGQVTAGP